MALAYSILLAGLGSRIEEFLEPVFAGHGYHVRRAVGLPAVLETISRSIDLVLIDLPSAAELPQLAEVRQACSGALIVVGPARNEKLLVSALEHGADDYVQRPFRTDELLARVRAQLRRRSRALTPATTVGPLVIDPDARTVLRHGAPLDLSPEEFALLATLAAQPGYCYPASYLLEQVWGRSHAGQLDLIGAAVAALRRLVEQDPAAPRIIGGDLATGYWLAPPGR